MTRKTLTYAIMLVLACSCEFSPSGNDFTVLPETDNTDMAVELNPDTSDTIRLFTKTFLRFKALYGTKTIKFVRAQLNDAMLTYDKISEGTLLIEPKYMQNGVYTLRIEIHASSGTGSLGDVRNREDFFIERSWPVIIDNSKPSSVDITTIQRVDGTLEVKWQRYGKFNFSNYKIQKSVYAWDGEYIQWIKDFDDINTTSLRDNEFVGGKVKYTIQVQAAEQTSNSTAKTFEDKVDFGLTAKWKDKTHIELAWHKTSYYANAAYWEIATAVNSDSQAKFRVTNIADTTLVAELSGWLFPSGNYLRLSLFPKTTSSYRDVAFSDIFLGLGDRFPFFSLPKIQYATSLNKYFALYAYDKPHLLLRLNGSDNQIEQSIQIDAEEFAMSPGGKLCAIEGNLVRLRDATDFTVIKSLDLNSLISSYGAWTVNVADNNWIALNNYKGTFIVDMNSGSIIQKIADTYVGARLSPTGNLLATFGKIYRWNATVFEEKGSFPTIGLKSIYFDGDSKLILVYFKELKILNLDSYLIERSMPTEAYDLYFDPVSKALTGMGDFNNKTYLYFLDENRPAAVLPAYNTIVLNNKLISLGATLPLSFYYP